MKLPFSKVSSPWRRWMDRLGRWSCEGKRSRRGQRRSATTRRLILEPLEDRTLLSAPPLGPGLLGLSSQQAPSISYSILLGDSNAESVQEVRGVAVDSSGYAAVVGITTAAKFPGSNQTNAGGYDAFLSRLSPSGELLWSKLLGGSSDDYAYGIALDSDGNIYITGQTTSLDFPGFAQADANTAPAFVSKFGPDGEWLWSTPVLNDAYGQAIAVASGDIYITGMQSDKPFVSKLNAEGEVVWSNPLGDTDYPAFYQTFSIAVDSSGNAYVAGTVQATEVGTFAWVSRLDSSGTPVWSRFFGGSGDDYGYGIALDSSGNAYVTGSTTSTDFPDVTGNNAGGMDAFVSKWTSSGNMAWSILVGGSGDDVGRGITVDSRGDIYITGTTAQTNLGSGDDFVAKLSGDGKLLWSTLLGGSGKEEGHGIAVDPSGNLYIAGYTESNNFPGPNGTVLSPANGRNAGFVVQLAGQDVEANPVPVLTSLSHTSIPTGSGQITLTINGSGFLPDSVVKWNGAALTTTYINATQLTAVVPADSLTQAVTASITVVNPAPGGGASNPLTFTVTEARPSEQPTNPGTPPPAAGASAAQEWNSYRGLYHLLSYQYFSKLGMDPFSSFTWGGIFAQFNANLGVLKGASPLVSVMLFNYFLGQGGDPYSSGILSTSFTKQGSSFMPATGSPSERATAYYENLGLPADDLTALYGYALGFGHPDDAIAALIAAQHGTPLT